MHRERDPCNSRADLERSSRSAGLRNARLGWIVGVAGVVGADASCRIYREPPSRDDSASPGSAGQPATSADDAIELDREATKPSAPTADALNLWVLSRPKGDLPTAAEPTPVSVAPADAPGAPFAALVVLGVGPGEACAEHFARQAVEALSAARPPLDVLSLTLASVRLWRWPKATSTLSATMKGSAGEFGGVQSAPVSAFGDVLLRQSIERHAVLGGQRPRWPAASSELPSEIAACEASASPSLAGPVGVLLRTAGGDFFGGVVNVDPPADAGVVSIAAQYGVSLAVGTRGGVLMIGDCDPPPLERIAERVYASDNWLLATGQLQTPGACRQGHALLSAERAWVAPENALAWAVIEAASSAAPVPSAPAVPALPALAPDAGLAHPIMAP